MHFNYISILKTWRLITKKLFLIFLFQYQLLQSNLPTGILVKGFEDRMVCGLWDFIHSKCQMIPEIQIFDDSIWERHCRGKIMNWLIFAGFVLSDDPWASGYPVWGWIVLLWCLPSPVLPHHSPRVPLHLLLFRPTKPQSVWGWQSLCQSSGYLDWQGKVFIMLECVQVPLILHAAYWYFTASVIERIYTLILYLKNTWAVQV